MKGISKLYPREASCNLYLRTFRDRQGSRDQWDRRTIAACSARDRETYGKSDLAWVVTINAHVACDLDARDLLRGVACASEYLDR